MGTAVIQLRWSDLEIDTPNLSGIESVMVDTDMQIHYLQVAYTSDTNKTVYGNSLSLQDGLTNSLLAAF